MFDLSWWHNGEQLSRSKTRQIDNATLQLQLLNAKTTDNGIYWCNQISDTKSGGINISLSVAGNTLFIGFSATKYEPTMYVGKFISSLPHISNQLPHHTLEEF